MTASLKHTDVSSLVQSPPLDLTAPYDAFTLAGKTVLITGAASGFGAAISRHWARLGANIIVTDVADAAGEKLVAELRSISEASKVEGWNDVASKGKHGHRNETNPAERHHFIHLNVSSWKSCASAFRIAVQELSPMGRIDIVLANAGIGESPDMPGEITIPADPSALLTAGLPGSPDPPEPKLAVLQTNLIGVVYTVHLALFWLTQNGTVPIGTDGVDRSIMLFGSVASIMGLPGTPQYCAAKHGVMGLFRSLRGLPSVWKRGRGVRLNLLCPYFVDTPIVPAAARVLLAGGGLAKVDEVVEGATRLAADESIVGRALAIGPRVKVKGVREDEELVLVDLPETDAGNGTSVSRTGDNIHVGAEDPNIRGAWEIYAEDFTATEAFVRRFVILLDSVETLRGWTGWWRDIMKAVFRRR